MGTEMKGGGEGGRGNKNSVDMIGPEGGWEVEGCCCCCWMTEGGGGGKKERRTTRTVRCCLYIQSPRRFLLCKQQRKTIRMAAGFPVVKNHREAGIHVSGNDIHIVVDTEKEAPVVLSAAQHPLRLTESYQLASKYLQGIETILDFMQHDQHPDDAEYEVVIHLDHLLTYNILTRYLAKWNRQEWHTSRNEPVPNVDQMKHMYRILQESWGNRVSFHNVSPSFAHQDPYLSLLPL